MSLHPFHSDRLILNPAGLAGVLTVLHLCMDLKNTLLGKYHYMLFYITAAMNPRMLMTVRRSMSRRGARHGRQVSSVSYHSQHVGMSLRRVYVFLRTCSALWCDEVSSCEHGQCPPPPSSRVVYSDDQLLASRTRRATPQVDSDLKPLPVNVRVGQAVETVGQAGKPKTITGFQTHTTPVLLGVRDRAEVRCGFYCDMKNMPARRMPHPLAPT